MKTDFTKSVAGVLIKHNKVLLARHTYGAGKGKLIVPGGYLEENETPQQAVIREYKEETKVDITVDSIIGIRFNSNDWYVVFKVNYVSGTEKSDNKENSEVLWIDVNEALEREDVADLSKKLIKCALSDSSLNRIEFSSNIKHIPYSFYGAI